MGDLAERAGFWAIVAVVLLATALIAGPTGIVILFGFASLQALREFLTLTHTRRADHWALLAAFFVVLPFQYILIEIDWYGMSSIMIPVYAFLGLPIVSTLRGDTTRFMERVAEVQWGLMTCVYCLSYVPALLMLRIEGHDGSMLLLMLFLGLVVQGAELLHEGMARVAPLPVQSKSLLFEFAVVGLSGALIGAILCWFTPFDAMQSAGLGAVAAMLGLAGSLVMEAVRRDRGVENWRREERFDRYSPGLLDRLERIVFAAPVFFHLVRFWWTA
jgi:phosphatidate cytidylyltransferase